MIINDVLVVGVGGQGVILTADVLASAFELSGHDVKKSEIHGMAQRGGSVESHVRRGVQVRSPLVPVGRADALVALELVEAVRYSHWVRPGGLVVSADTRILPSTVGAGLSQYPEDPENLLRAVALGPVMLAPTALARDAGDIRAANALVLGVLAALMPEISLQHWDEALCLRVPTRALDINRRAFAAGRQLTEWVPDV